VGKSVKTVMDGLFPNILYKWHLLEFLQTIRNWEKRLFGGLSLRQFAKGPDFQGFFVSSRRRLRHFWLIVPRDLPASLRLRVIKKSLGKS
jgi:hypothetical protein